MRPSTFPDARVRTPSMCVAVRSSSAMSERDRRHGLAAWQAIERLARDILRGRPGAHLLEGRPPVLDLRLPMSLAGRPEDAEAFAASLASEIERQIDDAIEEQAAFQPGHAWCH